MVCFIILHYMVKEETQKCVENLKKLFGEKKIIIVDNCSPDGSGRELQGKYQGDQDIVVYLNGNNDGFAKGNNIGCKVARKMFSPDFYVVMNNDVEICQTDFIPALGKIWESEKFDVLGPDIFSTSLKIHQSPKSLENMTLEKARKLQSEYKKKLKSKLIVPLRCYLKQVRILQVLYNHQRSKNLKINYTEKYYNIPLHGSCFVFSKNFINKRNSAFFPGTFFYFESEILDYECQKQGFKVLYDPSLKVYHHQNVSTNIAYKKALQRVRFMNEQNYNSITAFLNDYDS